jgi:hypothetical protein
MSCKASAVYFSRYMGLTRLEPGIFDVGNDFKMGERIGVSIVGEFGGGGFGWFGCDVGPLFAEERLANTATPIETSAAPRANGAHLGGVDMAESYHTNRRLGERIYMAPLKQRVLAVRSYPDKEEAIS